MVFPPVPETVSCKILFSEATWSAGHAVECAAGAGKRGMPPAAQEGSGNSSEAAALRCGVLHRICGLSATSLALK